MRPRRTHHGGVYVQLARLGAQRARPPRGMERLLRCERPRDRPGIRYCRTGAGPSGGDLGLRVAHAYQHSFSHIWQVIGANGRFCPGVVTATVLVLPIDVAEFVEASREAVLSGSVVVSAVIAGAIRMAFPIVMLKTKSLPHFRQNEKIPGNIEIGRVFCRIYARNYAKLAGVVS